MLQTLAVANYRSINKLVIPLGRLNLVTGPNGSGKSNLYRAHARRLIAALQEDPECNCIVLEKTLGQTGVVGQSLLDEPAWYWPD